MTESDEALRPALKRPERRPAEPPPAAPPVEEPAPPPAPEPAVDDAELERGRTLAVIAAIGRLQMSLDVLARQQKKHQEAVEARLARIERALGDR
ncbi:MAG TPA: hypothetical protein VNQ77_06320 [Frankiaceae bacterium]|nr:hypothetical protein [Frankiaceae bacterium]